MTSDETKLKQCAVCQQWLPATRDYFSPNGEGKLYSKCKECRRLLAKSHLVLLKFEVPRGYKRCSKCKLVQPATREFFSFDKRCSDGFQSICRKCYKEWRIQYNAAHPGWEAEYARLRYHANPEHFKELRRKWREANRGKVYEMKRRYRLANLDKKREWDRQWRERNPDKLREMGRRWRDKNPAYLKEYRQQHREHLKALNRRWLDENWERYTAFRRQYIKENPDRFRVLRERRRARLANLPHSLTQQEWLSALDYFGHRCAVCGRVPDHEYFTLALDHWIPICDPRPDNPGTVAWNAVPLCHCLEGGRDGCNNTKSFFDPFDWLMNRFGEDFARQKLAEIQTYFEWVKQRGKL